MYAIVEVGAKQYSIQKGDILEVEKQGVAVSESLVLDKVLLINDGNKIEVGQPYIKGAEVVAAVLQELKGEKKIAYKYRRRKAKHRKVGHRQQLTRIEIKEINPPK